MLKHTDGSLAAAEDDTDLTSREPIDEPQHHNLPSILGQRPERRSQPARVVRKRREPSRIEAGRRLPDEVPWVDPLTTPRSQRVRKLVMRNSKEPGAKGSPFIAEAVDGTQRREKGALGRVSLTSGEVVRLRAAAPT